MSRHIQTVNQPDRVSWNSTSDSNSANNAASNTFNVQLNTPLLEVEEVQLLRATVPQVGSPIPSYQLVFWYYELVAAGDVPNDANLFCIRLNPYGYAQVPNNYNTAANYVAAPSITALTGGLTELTSLLNQASNTGGDDVRLNGYWAANKISWTTQNGQITFKGNTVSRWYCPAGFNDPLVIAASNYTATNRSPSSKFYPVYYSAYITDPTYYKLPFVKGYSMNQRLGYAMSGTARGAFSNTADPGGQGNYFQLAYANSFNIVYPTATTVPADTPPNISGSSIVSIYASFSGYGGASTQGNKLNLLGVVPLSVLNGYNNFTGVGLKAPLYKVIPDVYSMDIDLRDENDQPFNIPDSSNLNLEIGFKYKNVNKPLPRLSMY